MEKTKMDVSTLSNEELKEIQITVNAQISKNLKQQVAAALDEIKEIVEESNLDQVELNNFVYGGMPNMNVKKTKVEKVAKYKDPKSNSTWSGYGRQPLWISSYEASGGTREDYLI
jgi:DNA-binding protein H-NS